MNKILVTLMISYSAIFASVSFSNKDWQVVCDNTHTCRMAGYTEYTTDREHLPISILLERKAGANTKIEGNIQIADYNDVVNPNNDSLIMYINNKSYTIDTSKKLPQLQTDTLIDALVKEKQIKFVYGDTYKLIFSQKGSFSCMLKMDEYQKRIGTIGAIFKKGTKKESNVLQPNSIPIVNAPAIYSNLKNKKLLKVTLEDKNKKLLQDLLSRDYGDDRDSICYHDTIEAKKTLNVYRLTDTLAVASQLCWSAAYNFSDAFWLINLKPPFEPKQLAQGTSIYINDDGTLHISNSHKGRGIGDCWSSDESVWDGEKFIKISDTSTGLCRGFAGGAWVLPTLTMKVKVQN